MYLRAIFIIILLSWLKLGFSSTPPSTTSLAPMLEKVSPAIVNIKADIKVTDLNTLRELQKQRDKNKKNNENNNLDLDLNSATYTSVASGVIVDAVKGYIITNAHVIADAQTITITLKDGHHYTAKLIGMDKPSDIALLQIKAKNLTAISFGNSNDLKVGDFVTAIGNPFDLNQTVTSGIISALGRSTLGIENFENFIQTDASINPGNSGGALINMNGQLVGINTAILAPDRGNIGIGFAIPINMAKTVMLQLLEYGNVKRGVLGIGVQSITPKLADAFRLSKTSGAAVTQILTQSPAQQAGILIGDIITSINGKEIKNANDVITTIGFLRVDSKTTMTLLRNNKPVTVTITLSDPKKRQAMVEQIYPFLYDVGLKDFTLYSPVHGDIQGVLVVSVERDSNSWHADLRPGDVIISINNQKVKNIADLRSATAGNVGKEILLNILRGPTAFFLVISKE